MTSAGRLSLLFFVAACGVSGEIEQETDEPARRRGTPIAWSTHLEDLGTFSSPRAADFNGDGIKDIVIGAGREEFIATDSAVIALDGATGAVLWHVGARDQMFGSAAIADLNDDGTPDVVIGGRSAELRAMDGTTGRVLWEFYPGDSTEEPRREGWYNFYNPQLIADQNGDGVEDLVIANGGDVLAEPGDPDRPAGRLVVVSGSDGSMIASAAMPDGRETYMSAVVADIRSHGDLEIIFGSGGETLGGHLFRTSLDALLNEDISDAAVLASSSDRGFIAPPVLADLTGDGVLDILANGVDGRIFAFDGVDNRLLWEVSTPETEAYSALAVGHFNEDDVLDVFASFAEGEWPNLGWSRQFMINGSTGQVVFADSLGLYQTASPVAVDINGDGIDEIILSVNLEAVLPLGRKRFYTMLVAIDFTAQEVLQFGDPRPGTNLASTPWLGDLDEDGMLDVIVCHTPDSLHTYVFNGLEINRMGTQISMSGDPTWGSYMGNRYTGVFAGVRNSVESVVRPPEAR